VTIRLSSKVDWLTVTRRDHMEYIKKVDNSLDAVVAAKVALDQLGFTRPHLEARGGERFYPWTFEDLVSGAKVSVAERLEVQGVRVVLSGSHLGDMSLVEKIADFARLGGWKFTRIDVALDIIGHETDWDKLLGATKAFCLERGLNVTDTGGRSGKTIYAGSRSSENMGRWYNKGAQQKVDYPWTRLEMEIKGHTAAAIGKVAMPLWNVAFGHFAAWSEGIKCKEFDLLRGYVATEHERVSGLKVVSSDRAVWFNGQVTKALVNWHREDRDEARRWVENMTSMLDILDGND